MNDNLFPLLAIETSSKLCSAAVLMDKKKYVELKYLDKQIHSEGLIQFIDNLIDISKLELKDIKAVAVSSGPGSFTGIRIGYSSVKGLAFGLDIPIIPVPSFLAFALEVSQYYKHDFNFGIAVKANSNEFYFGCYSKRENEIKETSPIELINTSDLLIYAKEKFIFSDIQMDFSLNIYSPSAYYVGLWACEYGKDKLILDYDLIEPNYVKQFIPKVKT